MPPEHLRVVELSSFRKHVCVGAGRDRQLPLTDEPRDLGPRAPLAVQRADPAVAQIVMAEHRDDGGAALVQRYLSEGTPRLNHFAEVTADLAELAELRRCHEGCDARSVLGAHRKLEPRDAMILQDRDVNVRDEGVRQKDQSVIARGNARPLLVGT